VSRQTGFSQLRFPLSQFLSKLTLNVVSDIGFFSFTLFQRPHQEDSKYRFGGPSDLRFFTLFLFFSFSFFLFRVGEGVFSPCCAPFASSSVHILWGMTLRPGITRLLLREMGENHVAPQVLFLSPTDPLSFLSVVNTSTLWWATMFDFLVDPWRLCGRSSFIPTSHPLLYLLTHVVCPERTPFAYYLSLI